MKKAAPYQPTLSRPLNSCVILGMAVATIVWTNVSLLELLFEKGVHRRRRKAHHVEGQKEDAENQSHNNEEQLEA